MRRGCIAVGIIKCDNCEKSIEHGERYLIIEDESGTEKRLCLDCCTKKNYGKYEIEKGEEILTLLIDEPQEKVIKKPKKKKLKKGKGKSTQFKKPTKKRKKKAGKKKQ